MDLYLLNAESGHASTYLPLADRLQADKIGLLGLCGNTALPATLAALVRFTNASLDKAQTRTLKTGPRTKIRKPAT
jgi:hypothetical protein